MSLVGSLVLVALSACKPGWFEEREPWRREAEVECLKSGTVKESPSVALLGPISGPGMCGADFPLKVAALGESAALGYADEPIRPPGAIPQVGASYLRPVYPSQPQYSTPNGYPPNTPFSVNPAYPADTRLPLNPDYRSAPPTPAARHQQPYPPPQNPPQVIPQYPPQVIPQYPPPAEYSPPYSPSAPYRPSAPNGPISLTPPGIDPGETDAEGIYQAPPPNYGAPRTVPPRGGIERSPLPSAGEPYRPEPRERAAPRYPGSSGIVPLSPSRNRTLVASTASVTPAATLACPIVSALDRWIMDAVQPAAQKWFGQPVTEIKQISAYSCRGMNGNPNARISEHAFGNALDIASFALSDGHRISVKDGWRGAPEEQGFLRDVQAAACEQFTTVLAPGSNVYHYDHIHVDLMRRASGRRICEPGAVSGDLVAERARARYARSRDPSITGSISRSDRSARRRVPYSAFDEEDDRSLPMAIAGED